MQLIIVLVVAMAGVGFVLYARVLRHLRTHHETAWISLGRPNLILTNFTGKGYAVQRFLWKREFERRGDPSLSRKCWVFLYFLSTFLFALPVIVLVLSRGGPA